MDRRLIICFIACTLTFTLGLWLSDTLPAIIRILPSLFPDNRMDLMLGR